MGDFFRIRNVGARSHGIRPQSWSGSSRWPEHVAVFQTVESWVLPKSRGQWKQMGGLGSS